MMENLDNMNLEAVLYKTIQKKKIKIKMVY